MTTRSEQFKSAYGQYASTDAIRRVWAEITRTPRASTRELGERIGLHQSVVACALRYLDRAGYVRYHGKRARTVIVPFVIIERKG